MSGPYIRAILLGLFLSVVMIWGLDLMDEQVHPHAWILASWRGLLFAVGIVVIFVAATTGGSAYRRREFLPLAALYVAGEGLLFGFIAGVIIFGLWGEAKLPRPADNLEVYSLLSLAIVGMFVGLWARLRGKEITWGGRSNSSFLETANQTLDDVRLFGRKLGGLTVGFIYCVIGGAAFYFGATNFSDDWEFVAFVAMAFGILWIVYGFVKGVRALKPSPRLTGEDALGAARDGTESEGRQYARGQGDAALDQRRF